MTSFYLHCVWEVGGNPVSQEKLLVGSSTIVIYLALSCGEWIIFPYKYTIIENFFAFVTQCDMIIPCSFPVAVKLNLLLLDLNLWTLIVSIRSYRLVLIHHEYWRFIFFHSGSTSKSAKLLKRVLNRRLHFILAEHRMFWRRVGFLLSWWQCLFWREVLELIKLNLGPVLQLTWWVRGYVCDCWHGWWNVCARRLIERKLCSNRLLIPFRGLNCNIVHILRGSIQYWNWPFC